jgi:predicted RNA-binding Zn-ribbon protein involved in translation (DUF1610 family)
MGDLASVSAASEERRCPSCGSRVAVGADWCALCYAPVAAPSITETRGGVSTPGGGALHVAEGKPAWTCAACGETNPIDAATCATCGTAFTRLFEQPVERPEIDPENAAVWSLLWPGLGHWKAGYRADAIARGVLFAWTFGALSILLVSRFGKGGLGATFPLFLLFASSSAAVYAVSALDAYRVAGGHDPLVSSRALLWGSAALVVLSVLIATFLTLPAARQ